jgi:hypothetical protein
VIASQQLAPDGVDEPALAREPEGATASSSGPAGAVPPMQPAFDGKEAAA